MKEANQQRKEFVLQFVYGQFLVRPGLSLWSKAGDLWQLPGCQRAQISNTLNSNIPSPYLSMPEHLDCAISCLSRQDKAAFTVFRPFNGSDWPCQQGLLSGRSKPCSHFSLPPDALFPPPRTAHSPNLFWARQKQNPKSAQDLHHKGEELPVSVGQQV